MLFKRHIRGSGAKERRPIYHRMHASAYETQDSYTNMTDSPLSVITEKIFGR
jgi:hypothetical protein